LQQRLISLRLTQLHGDLASRGAAQQLLYDIGVPEEAALSHLILENHSSCSPAQPPSEVRVSCSDLSHEDGASEAPFKFKSHLLE
jgi:hypothetical protein